MKQYKLLIANGHYLKQVRKQRLGFYIFIRRKLLAFLVGIDCYDIIIVVFAVSILKLLNLTRFDPLMTKIRLLGF